MIKKLGTSIKNIGTKTLILIIALSFAVWGLGDIFTGNTNPTIATVGKSKIKLNDFNLEYQTILNNLRQGSDEPLPEEFIKTLGIHNSVINNMINNEYINLLSKELGIASSDNFIRKSIIKNKNFHDQLGVFNKDYFNYYLNRYNISEKELLTISEKNLVNDILIKTIEGGTAISKIIINNIIQNRDTTRKAEIYEVDTSSLIIKEKITDNQIRKHYDKIKNTLLIAEKRNINIITINNKNIDTNIQIKEKEILDVYNANLEFYKTPEKRKILQLIFKTELKAKEFIKNIKNLKSLNQYIKQNNINKDEIDLGILTKNELSDDISEISFNLEKKTFSNIIKSAFGWKIVFIEDVIPEKNVSLVDVKASIKKDLINNLISERIYEKANSFYEKFIETNDLDVSLKFTNLEKEYIKNVEIDNIKNIKIIKNNYSEEELAKIIFNLKKGSLSDPLDNKNNNLFFIHLEEIVESTPKNFNDAKKEVVDSIYKNLRKNQAKKIADNVYNILLQKKTPDQSSYSLIKTNWITNDNRLENKIDPKIKKIIFKTKLNTFSKINEVDEYKYVFVKPTEQSNKVLDKEKKSLSKNILLNIDNNIDNDILNALLIDLKIEKKSKINQNFINSF